MAKDTFVRLIAEHLNTAAARDEFDKLLLVAPPPFAKLTGFAEMFRGGEPKSREIAARYADAWNTWGPPDHIDRKTRVLERHCADLGRDPAVIERTRLVASALEDRARGLRSLFEQTPGFTALTRTPSGARSRNTAPASIEGQGSYIAQAPPDRSRVCARASSSSISPSSASITGEGRASR